MVYLTNVIYITHANENTFVTFLWSQVQLGGGEVLEPLKYD